MRLLIINILILFTVTAYSQEYKRMEGEKPRNGLTVKTVMPEKANAREVANPVKQCEIDLDDFINGSNQWIIDNELGCNEITFLIDVSTWEEFEQANKELLAKEPWPYEKWEQYRNIVDDTEKKFKAQGKTVRFAKKENGKYRLKQKGDLPFINKN